MRVRAQIGMVLNLDKCIGCHTCSVTCKNVWTSREGVEYAWFNNVETKPGVGYPKDWENQKRWKGGWKRTVRGSIEPRIGAKWRVLANIFANPDLPEIDDYYEPFTFDYAHLQTAPEGKIMPTARPRSLISGERMEKIKWGPNWEEILGGEFARGPGSHRGYARTNAVTASGCGRTARSSGPGARKYRHWPLRRGRFGSLRGEER